MAPKKTTRKAPKVSPKVKKKFKFIKGYAELVEDPFNLN